MNFISSFFDNIKDKTTNPFFGTLIFVWLVRNWDLVYTVFNFDNDCNLEDKKRFIRGYYEAKVIWQEIGINVSIAFGLMLLGYVLIILSRLVVNVTDHNIIPWMNNKTVSKLVVNKDRFETVKKTRDEYFVKILDFEEQVVELEQKNSILKKANIELESKIRENKKSISSVNDELVLANQKIDSYEVEQFKNSKNIDAISSKLNNTTSNYDELKSLIVKHLNNLDVFTFESFNDVIIPEEIKKAYFDLNTHLFGNKEDRISLPKIDSVFFDIAENMNMNSGANFSEIYIDFFIGNGLMRFKSTNEEDGKVKRYDTDSLELTVLGELVIATEEVYFALKKNEVLN